MLLSSLPLLLLLSKDIDFDCRWCVNIVSVCLALLPCEVWQQIFDGLDDVVVIGHRSSHDVSLLLLSDLSSYDDHHDISRSSCQMYSFLWHDNNSDDDVSSWWWCAGPSRLALVFTLSPRCSDVLLWCPRRHGLSWPRGVREVKKRRNTWYKTVFTPFWPPFVGKTDKSAMNRRPTWRFINLRTCPPP